MIDRTQRERFETWAEKHAFNLNTVDVECKNCYISPPTVHAFMG